MAMMDRLYSSEGLDPWVCERTLEYLSKPKTTAINRPLPYNLRVASKYGNMRDSYCDIGIVYHPERPYILAVMTREIPEDDIRKQGTIDEISKISKITYDHFDSLS